MFLKSLVLPKRLIEKANIAAINFHQGRQNIQEWMHKLHLYDEVSEYGVTAHLMNELVDNGKIEVRRFQ